MNTNIFVPSKINVGFQNRKGTYTGKLAYVIYFDEKGKLRKEPSWNNWRNKEIPNEIYDNEPTEGFVLNKKVGGVEESWGWDARKTYTRVYDPRGFEFEITIPNLLWILENCNCIKGKGLEGQFVYGWDGKDLVLVPTESPDYKEIEAKSAIRHNDEFVKAKELIVGATYETLKGEKYVYMGKHDVYQTLTNRYRDYSGWYSSKTSGWGYPLDDTWKSDSFSGNYIRYKDENIGKQFWFIKLGDPNSDYSWDRKDSAVHFKSVTRKFSKVISEKRDDYPELYEEVLQRNCDFSPINYDGNKVLPISLNTFNEVVTKELNKPYPRVGMCYLQNGTLTSVTILYDKSENRLYYEERICTDNNIYGSRYVRTYADSIEELYDKLQPMYGEQYLENGKLYRRVGYYGSEE